MLLSPWEPDRWRLGDCLGQGAYSEVRSGVDVDTGIDVAVKVLPKSHADNRPDVLAAEVAVLKRAAALDSPHIVQLLGAYEDEANVYLVMEKCHGWTLEQLLKVNGFFSEQYAAWVVKQVACALQALHAAGVLHRDIKPANLVFKHNSPGSPLKLVDFGFACFIPGSRAAMEEGPVGACKEDEVVGSHSYVAPEVMRRQEYGPAADVWSLGILMHTLLCGEVPFESDLQARLSPVMFFQKLWTTVSAPAKSLLKDLLEAKEPRARMGLAALLRHSWLAMAEEPVLQAQHTFEELQPGAHRMRCPSHCEPQARTGFAQEPVRRGMVFARVQPARLRGMRAASSTAGRRHTFCARSVSAPSLLDRAAHTCTCALVPSDSTTALADAVHSRRVSPVRGVSLDISPARSAEGSDVDVDGVAFVLPAAPKGIAATSQRAPNPLQVAESI